MTINYIVKSKLVLEKIFVMKIKILVVFCISFLIISSCKDKCKDVNCDNGTCVEGTCNCSEGYEGNDCGTESRSKFIGSYVVNGTETCSVSGNSTLTGMSFTISNSSAAINKITLNLGGGLLILTATVNGSSFTIIPTTISVYSYSGSGTINGNSVTCTINSNDSFTPETCVYSLTGSK